MAASKGSELMLKSRTSLERASDRELVIARTFNGPARIVFDAWTRPEHVSRWWAPQALGVSVVSCDAEVRVGGRYRYVLQPRKGGAIAFSGEYLEVTPHSRLVYTSFFEPTALGPMEGVPAVVVTVTFDEQDGRTHMVSRELYPSKEVLDGALASGMEPGVHATMDQLDELVSSLRSGR
jgi:uncharacterized protein YndB with AHSA1/START domain